ncbi:MAG: hypothetical protein GY745_04915 [Actinomycetia bacterium]|nr:hypothetical protein [Actinomycetes bacterium]MCP4084381.1 hypothetical protein [Actinomycetes bacterium]
MPPSMPLHEVIQLRQSVAMLQPGALTQLDREQVLRLIHEVEELRGDLTHLRSGLRGLLDAGPG